MLLCAVQFLDIADAAIVNVALPSIQHSLGFSQQNLQWVASGYILTYGGYRALLADSILMAAAEQLRSLGRRDSNDLALGLLAAYEGSALLANTMHDPNVLSRAARRLNHWIDTL